MMRAIKLTGVLVLLSFCFSGVPLRAQQVNPGTETGLPPYGTFSGSSFDQVNVQNRNLHISIPILSVKERGGRVFTWKYEYDTPTYQIVWIPNPNAKPHSKIQGYYSDQPVNDVTSGWRLSTPFSWSTDYVMASSTCPTAPYNPYSYTNEYSLTDPDGTKHQFPMYKEGDGTTTACYGNFLSGPAEDGSGIVWNLQTNIVTLKDGTQVNLNTDTIQDTNGNFASPSEDMLGRNPLVVTDVSTKTYTTPLGVSFSGPAYTLWTYTDSNGNQQSYRIDYGAYDMGAEACPSGTFFGQTCAEVTGTKLLPIKITLPNGKTYQFSYQNDGQAELLQVTLPTGATIRYGDYAGFYVPQPDTGKYETYMGRQALSTRTVTANGTTNTWNYSNYTVTDPLGNQTVYSFNYVTVGTARSASEVEQSAAYYNGSASSGQMLKQVAKTWTGNGWSVYNETLAIEDLRVTSETTTLDNGLESQVQTDYGASDSYGGYSVPLQEPTEVREYGYGSGAPGSLMRKTDYSYLFTTNTTYENLNMLDRVGFKTIYDASGRVAQTNYEYDNYRQAIQTPSAVQHNSSFGSGYTTRGNVTAVTRLENTSTGASVTTRNQYDDLGNVVATTDPCGNATCTDMTGASHTTTYSYADSWGTQGGAANCAPSGGGAYAYVTSTTNALGQVTKDKYYSCSGLHASTTDPNNQTTSYAFDAFGRPTETDHPDGGKTTHAYDDTNLITTTGVLHASAAYLYTRKHYDKLGRLIEDELCEDGTTACTPSIKTDYAYDALDRLISKSNPYRSGDSIYYTHYQYDALNRLTKTIPTDGSATSDNLTTVYSGNMATVTDEAGHQRRTFNDVLGRLIEVDEPGPSGTSGSASTATGSFTVSGTEQTATGAPATSGGYQLTLSGTSDKSKQVGSTPGTGSITFSGSDQSKTTPGTPGTGSITFSGSDQSKTIPGTPGKGWVDITGAERSMYIFGPCPGNPGKKCQTLVYDGGTVSVTVNGVTSSTGYGTADTPYIVATNLASAVNNNSGSPVTAQVATSPDGYYVNLTAKQNGASTNYTLAASSATQSSYFTGTSFPITKSGNNLTGGTDSQTIHDSGTVTVTINGTPYTYNYGQSDTSASHIASGLASVIGTGCGGPVKAYPNPSGGTLYLTSCSAGSGTNYSYNVTITNDSADFPSQSFTAPSSGNLTGGTDSTTTYDSGTVTVTVTANGTDYPYAYHYGQSDTSASSIATGLYNVIGTGCSGPVKAYPNPSGGTLNLTSCSAGSGTNYPYIVTITNDSAHFPSPSFTAPSSGSFSGGTDKTIYDSGTLTVTVNGRSDSASYGQGDTNSLVGQRLASAITNDSGAYVNASYNSDGTITLTSRATGAATNYNFTTSSQSNDSADFNPPSFTLSPPSGQFTGGQDAGTVYDSGNLSMTVGGYTATVNYGQSSTFNTLASALASAFNGDLNSPVTAGNPTCTSTMCTVPLTSKAEGPGADYTLTPGGASNNSTQFPQASFTASSGSLTGGSDETDRVLSLSTPIVTLYTYDALGNLLKVVQNGSHLRTFTYDALSRLLSSDNPETGQVTYSYDANGNMISRTAPAPNQTNSLVTITTTYDYDNLNRLKAKNYSNGDPSITYTYDQGTMGIGRRTGMTDAAGSESWTYDAMGRILTDQRSTNNITKTFSYTYLPYVDGSLYKLTYPSGRTVTYSYDSASRLRSAADQANGINYASGATYAAHGGLTSLVLGTSGTFSGINLTQIYNQRLQTCWIYETTGVPLPTTTHCPASDPGPANILDLRYDFNVGTADNGNVARTTNDLDSTRSQTFTYDGLNRLLTAQTTSTNGMNCWGLAFDYDVYGNLTNQDVVGNTSCYASGFSISVNGYNHVNEFAYDAAGNVTNDSHNNYTWNGEGEMKAAAGVTYTYDGDGQRVEKSNGKLYWYGQDGEVLDESDASGNITNEYVYFGGKRIAWRNSSGEIHYYAEDSLGTSRVIMTSAGVVCYDADFYPYGGERTVTDSCSQDFKFTGKERDSETGNDYFGARFYTSSFGRFLSADPVEITPGRLRDPQQLNLYSYVRNNPLHYVDQNGETLQISGDASEAEKELCKLIGGDCKRITYNPKTHTITVDLTGINLNQNEGALLLSNVINSSNVYNLDLGNTMLTAGGPQPLMGDNSIQNLDNKPDWRYGKGKTAKDRPAAGVNDQIGINPNDAVFRDSMGRRVPLSSLIFHELAEAYAKIDEGKQYVYRNGTPGAHAEAVRRELRLRSQRPNMKLQGRAGDQLIREPKSHN